MKQFFTCLFALVLLNQGNAQRLFTGMQMWTDLSQRDVTLTGERRIVPTQFRLLSADMSNLEALLDGAPLEFTPLADATEYVVAIPMPDGSFQRFDMNLSPIMEPGLANRYPMIRTYNGQGIENAAATIRCDITPQGFHAMILSPEGTVFIDPYQTGDRVHYISYYKRHFVTNKTMDCLVGTEYDEINSDHFHPGGGTPNYRFFGDCTMRTYRLAVSATGEYSNFHGGNATNNNKAIVLAAQVTTMNRVNGVFEKEAAIRMILIANNDQIIYLSPGSDPFTNGTPGTMINENQTNTDAVIGTANYDIGHIFGTNSGGLAQLNSPCTTSKARGVTGSGAPVGDPFDIDYVAHEMGHQFGGRHTQNNNCNRDATSCYEPGSASTIMGYAGICAPDVQNNSDDYYHAISLSQFGTFVTGTTGNSCDVPVVNGNSAPSVTVTQGAYTIPPSTPFFLTAQGSDPNPANTITYCWEQYNNQVSTQAPLATSTSGPNFRSFDPTTSPTRYFPSLAAQVANGPFTWEVLPSVARTMNFRCTVRDNFASGGCTAHTDVAVTVAAGSPFTVLVPSNTGLSYPANSTQTVTWNVAGTNAAPVSCANVNILISLDGGLTYPTVLASNVPNNGSATVTMPGTQSTTARVMVVCADNIFYDISNNNFSITAPVSDFLLSMSPTSLNVCAPNNAVYTINVGSSAGFSNQVTLTASGLPAGATATFGTNPIVPGNTTTLTISGLGTAGTSTISVQGSSTTGTKTVTSQLVVSTAPTGTVTLGTPANNATGVATTPTLTWTALSGATSYDLQISTNTAFTAIVEAPTGIVGTTYSLTTLLNTNTVYYWRVRGVNACGQTAYSTTRSFTTTNQACNTYASTNVPIAITAVGTPTVTSTINIAAGATITDINVLGLIGTHTYISDLDIVLTSPAGTSVTLFSSLCNNQDNFNLNFDDEATNAHTAIPCPPTGGGTYQPEGTLSSFDGQNMAGTWTLSIVDNFDQDGGSLTGWSLQICGNPITSCTMTASATATAAGCAGNTGTVTVTPTGGASPYSYNRGTGAQASNTFTGLTPGAYTVTVTDNAGCTATATATVASTPSPTAAVTGTNTICNGASTTLTASGGGTYLWSNASTTVAITVSPTATTTYTVTVTNASGCTATATRTVTVNALPTAAATGNNTICAGASTTLTASGGTGYAWSNGTNTAANTVSPATTTTYTVTVTNAAGCTATATRTVTVNAAPNAAATGTNTICNGASTTLTASGGGTYLWSNASTTAAITVSPSATTTYTVTVTNASGCTATATRTVTVNALPNAAATGTNTICNGASTTLTASGGTSYAWSNGTNTAANTVSPTTTTTYTVTVTNAAGCTATATRTVTVNALPSAAATGTNTICAGASTTLTASGGTSYAWSNGTNTAANTVTPTTTTTYTVTVTNAAGCTATATRTVTVNTVPNAAVTGTNTICNGGSTTLTASGGGTYLWSNTSTTAAITVSPTATTTYTVTVTNASGCTATATRTVSVGSNPTAAVTGNNVLCAGESTVLTASGGTSYLWSNGGNITASITVSPSITTTYTVTVTNAAGCTATATRTVTVNPSTIAAINGNNAVCAGESTILSASGGTSFLWSNGDNTASITVAPTTTTTYTVTATNAAGCTASTSTTVSVGAIPTATIAGDTEICAGENTVLTAAGGDTYTWSNGSTDADIIVNPTSATSYTVTVTNIAGCTATASVQVNVNTAASTNIIAQNTACSGTTVSLIASGTGDFIWSNGVQTPLNQLVATTTTVFTVTLTDANGCTSTDTHTLTVNDSPVFSNTIQSDETCDYANDGNIDLTISAGQTPFSFLWSNTATTEDLTNLEAGTYTCTVTDANACTATTTVVITEPAPFIVDAQTTDAQICFGEQVVISANAGATFAWSTGQTSASFNIVPQANTNFSVTATDLNGCTSTDDVFVQVFPQANPTITVNGSDLVSSFASSYQWYFNGAIIPGANAQTYTPQDNGTYTVEIVTGNGCTWVSADFEVTFINTNIVPQPAWNIYPNPSTGDVFATGLPEGSFIEVYDVLGRMLFSVPVNATLTTVSLTELPSAVYILKVDEIVVKVVKE